MADLTIDEAQVQRAVQALRALAAETLSGHPEAAAHATGHAGLIAAVARVDAEQRRAVTAICAEASSLADAAEGSVAEILDVDRRLARPSLATLAARSASDGAGSSSAATSTAGNVRDE
ncbi:hypothetical protein [Demequina salsinemoris]|uniref:hypothetical protein n=1 Tax=Demequina salsinemoris TaxID=577470 RepID=UPI00078466A3|nr:hypothetical protein [Demequina salsinemoris]